MKSREAQINELADKLIKDKHVRYGFGELRAKLFNRSCCEHAVNTGLSHDDMEEAASIALHKMVDTEGYCDDTYKI